MSDEAWIDTVRLARDMGDVSQLLPAGVKSLRDIPARLLSAIREAMVFLSFESLEEDDTPPKSIWTDPRSLKRWFEDVKRKHARGDDQIDDPVQNDVARGLIV